MSSSLPNHPVTSAHLSSSRQALAELCEIVTVTDLSSTARPLFNRFCHYDHGFFLNPLLHGFPVLGVTGTEVNPPEIRPPIPQAVQEVLANEWQESGLGDHLRTATASVATEVSLPDASREDQPFTYAITVGLPVEKQIEIALSSLASLLSRQRVTQGLLKSGDIGDLDIQIGESDIESRDTTSDVLRSYGWEAAARQIRHRSIAQNMPLVVRYEVPLFSREQLAARAPVLRRVYNEFAEAQLAVDKVAALMSQGLTVVGSSNDETLRSSLDVLDVGAVRTYLAHMARDAFVCGNGALQFGEIPDSDIRLIAPEHLQLINQGNAPVTARDEATGRIGRALHTPGAEQVGSIYGVSKLEPLLAILAHRDTMLSSLYLQRNCKVDGDECRWVRITGVFQFGW